MTDLATQEIVGTVAGGEAPAATTRPAAPAKTAPVLAGVAASTAERLDAFYAVLKHEGLTLTKSGGNVQFSRASVGKDVIAEAKALKPWLLCQLVIDEYADRYERMRPLLDDVTRPTPATEKAYEEAQSAAKRIDDAFEKGDVRKCEDACKVWLDAWRGYAKAGGVR